MGVRACTSSRTHFIARMLKGVFGRVTAAVLLFAIPGGTSTRACSMHVTHSPCSCPVMYPALCCFFLCSVAVILFLFSGPGSHKAFFFQSYLRLK
mgnify:CR=1 FL=1